MASDDGSGRLCSSKHAIDIIANEPISAGDNVCRQ